MVSISVPDESALPPQTFGLFARYTAALNEMHALDHEISTLGEESVVARRAMEKAEAQARIQIELQPSGGKKTVGFMEAKVTLETEEERMLYHSLKQRISAAKGAKRTFEEECKACQETGYNMRAETRVLRGDA